MRLKQKEDREKNRYARLLHITGMEKETKNNAKEKHRSLQTDCMIGGADERGLYFCAYHKLLQYTVQNSTVV